MPKEQTLIRRARRTMAHAIARHAEAETLRQERKRAGQERGARRRYRETLYLADMADLADGEA